MSKQISHKDSTHLSICVHTHVLLLHLGYPFFSKILRTAFEMAAAQGHTPPLNHTQCECRSGFVTDVQITSLLHCSSEPTNTDSLHQLAHAHTCVQHTNTRTCTFTPQEPVHAHLNRGSLLPLPALLKHVSQLLLQLASVGQLANVTKGTGLRVALSAHTNHVPRVQGGVHYESGGSYNVDL